MESCVRIIVQGPSHQGLIQVEYRVARSMADRVFGSRHLQLVTELVTAELLMKILAVTLLSMILVHALAGGDALINFQ